MEAQDQLQRNYISKKEEHRALEMQNYMGLSRNTGTFDPDRSDFPSWCDLFVSVVRLTFLGM